MKWSIPFIAFCGLLTPGIIGCGGGGVAGPPAAATPSSVSVTVTFTGVSPTGVLKVALQTGSGPFIGQTLQNGQLTFTLPSMTSKYSLSWNCADEHNTTDIVLDATPLDGTQYVLDCRTGISPALPSGGVMASGSLDATAIPGTSTVSVFGKQGNTQGFQTTAAFGLSVQPGLNDIAIVPIDASFNALAVKILHNQTIPGPINGGNTIVLGAGDQVANEPLTVNNIPAGFPTSPPVTVSFQTVNGTAFQMTSTATTQYPAVPAASIQSGDSYIFSTQSSGTSQSVGITQSNTSGGAVTLTLPQPWNYSGPAPADVPTFTFNYPGTSGLGTVTELAILSTTAPPPISSSFSLAVLATPSYQNGANTITMPDFTGGSGGFFPSGTNVMWTGVIIAANGPLVHFLPSLPLNGSIITVQTFGNFTVP